MQAVAFTAQLAALKDTKPLVHNIGNHVVLNTLANALLAIGASPIMAHAHPEINDMVALAGATVINIGTLDEYYVESMLLAVKACKEHHKPWVLDPVGAGASKYRDEILVKLLSENSPAVIKGNASEILALAAGNATGSKGVDSLHASDKALKEARLLSENHGCVVCISGETDYVVSQNSTYVLTGGHAMMSQITGMGCTASALIGAFCAVSEGDDYLSAALAAISVMNVAGENAAKKAMMQPELQGLGFFPAHFISALTSLSVDDFALYLQRSKFGKLCS